MPPKPEQKTLKFVAATMEDAAILFEWRNHEETRRQSLSMEEVTWNEHLNWLQKSLNNAKRSIWLVWDQKKLIGTLRQDLETDGSKMLSWTIAPAHQGQSYGFTMLQQFTNQSAGTLRALIKDTNIASKKMAEKVGFQPRVFKDGVWEYYCLR